MSARIGYFDCFSGVAGDMTLAALLDAGWPLEQLEQTIARLNLPGVSLRAEKVKRHGIAAMHVAVELGPESGKKHRHLHHIAKIIDDAGLPPRVCERAKAVFRRLAEAEARVHATTIEKVHFHEVGAADAIVDIVGACAGLEQLGVERIFCSPVPTGNGTVRCEHGVMPVPAPATAELLKGVPLAECEEPGELTTPTGAALVTTLAENFGPLPAMKLEAVGCGAGTREGKTRPNVMRLLLGQAGPGEAGESDIVCVLEAQVDDSTGQALAYAVERLHDAGALDVFLTPIGMKKGRPGQLLTVLAQPQDVEALEDVILRETSSFGVRRHTCRRATLAREHASIRTRFGPIRVKIGRRGGRVLHGWPEYEDCAAAARSAGVPLVEVQQEALRMWSQGSNA